MFIIKRPKQTYNEHKIMFIIHAIRKSFKYCDDLLTPEYRKKKFYTIAPTESFGHCYIACEALYYLFGAKNRDVYKPHYVKVNGNKDTHWFLANKDMTVILDPTCDQFMFSIPYEGGVRCGFLTAEPSKRTEKLIKRTKAQIITLKQNIKSKNEVYRNS